MGTGTIIAIFTVSAIAVASMIAFFGVRSRSKSEELGEVRSELERTKEILREYQQALLVARMHTADINEHIGVLEKAIVERGIRGDSESNLPRPEPVRAEGDVGGSQDS